MIDRNIELNYRYCTGFIKEDAENTIRNEIQRLSLLIISLGDKNCTLYNDIYKEREYWYNVLGNKPKLFLVK